MGGDSAPARIRERRMGWSFVALAVLTAAGLMLVAQTRAGGATGPTITIDGTAPYRDGQTVTVHGSGLAPGEELFAEECESGGICNRRVGGPQTVAADGTVTTTAVLNRFFLDYVSSYGDEPVDCATGACRLGLIALNPDAEDGYDVRASIPITFDDSLAWHPEASVAPTTSLPPRSTLHVAGHGFAPSTRALARFCSARDCWTQADTTTSATGDLDASLDVVRLGEFFDCLTEPCRAEVLDDDSVIVATTTLRFDPDQSPVLPELIVAPDHELGLHDTVLVGGRNYTPGATFRVHQCARDEAAGLVSACASSVPVAVGPAGTFLTLLPVDRYITSDFGTPVDCAVPGRCGIWSYGGSVYPVVAKTPIVFAAVTDDPAIHLEGVKVTEGTGATPTLATAHVVVDRPAPKPIDVLWTTNAVGDTAEVFTDFGFRHEHAVIPAGATSADLVVPIVADALDEPTESLTIDINRMNDVRIAPGGDVARVTIVDDDPAPRIDVGNALVAESTDHATVPVQLSAVSGRDVTVTYRTRGASARPGKDYVTTTGSLVIPAGTDTASIEVPIVDDRAPERLERLQVLLSRPSNARIGDGRGSVWIADDDVGEH